MRTALGSLMFVTIVGCSSTTETVTVPGECAEGGVDGSTDDSAITLDADATTADTTTADTAVAIDSTTDSGSPIDSAATDSVVVADTGPGCAIKAGGDICTKIPKLTFAGSQVVDGIGDEFCDVPATLLATKTGTPLVGTALTSLPGKLRARIAWSALGIHAHFHVEDPEVVGLGPLAASDEVRLFISGKAPVFGEYVDRRDKSAFALMMYPASPRDLALPGFTGKPPGYAQLLYLGHQRPTDMTCQGVVVPLPKPAEYASRIVDDGYEMELFLPWAVLGRTTAPTSGAEIAVAMMLSEIDDPAAEKPPFFPDDSALTARVFYKYNTVGGFGGTCCSSATPQPDCDDRAWCVSPLE